MTAVADNLVNDYTVRYNGQWMHEYATMLR